MSAQTTRRGLFGASAGLLFLALPAVASVAKATDLDRELLTLESELQTLDARIASYDHADDDSNWPAFEALQGEYWEVVAKLEGIPARTTEGLQAKARIARSLIRGGGIDPENATGRHIEGLLADLLGEAPA